MKTLRVNRKYKDSIFRMLFSEKTELLSLYNAIRGTNYTNEADLQINTLENVIYMSMKNDISFVLDERLSIFEHQSTVNGNMPLRNLFYIADLLSGAVENANLYGSKTISLPNPYFVTFYNGTQRLPDRSVQKLSHAYKNEGEEVNLELTVIVLNINYGHNEELMEKCKTLREYAYYIDRVRYYIKTMPIEEAVEKAIKECIGNDVLAEFLRTRRAEVKHVSIYEYDAEKHIAQEKAASREEGYSSGREEGYSSGREEGYSSGREEGIRGIVHSLKEIGVDTEIIVVQLMKQFSLGEEEARWYAAL